MSFLKREGIDYLSNFYRFKKYDENNYLITVEDGSFLFIHKLFFKKFRQGKIKDFNLFEKLKLNNIIIDESNFNYIVNKTTNKYSFLINGTSLHIIILTTRCNLKCSYCYASTKNMNANIEENDLNFETSKKIVDFIFTSPSSAITIEFQGGEILANFEIVKKIVEYAKQKNKKIKKDLKFGFTSNFVLMTEKIANWFIDNDIPFCTSLDGPKNVHDQNRFMLGKKNNKIGSYDKVVYWIKRINEIYKERGMNKSVNALMTITKYSLPYYKEIIDEYINLNIYNLSIRSMTNIGRGLNNDDLTYDINEFNKFYEKSLKYIDELNKKNKNIKIIERLKELYITKIIKQMPGYHTEFENPCGATTGQLLYHNNGNIYTCNEAMGHEEFKLGNVFNDNWKGLFDKKETRAAILNSMIESNFICDKCVYKPYCGTCMVENYFNLGKFNFYPTNTQKHFTTVYQCKKIFDEILKNSLNKENNLNKN